LTADYMALARHLGVRLGAHQGAGGGAAGGGGCGQMEASEAVRVVKLWLSHNEGWLMILDNADSPSSVSSLFPDTTGNRRILLTTRAASAGTASLIPLDVMDM